MAKAAVTSFIIDLKFSPDQQVKILELGPAFNYSGFSGYEHLTGENPLEKHVGPFYNQQFALPIYHLNHQFFSSYYPQIGIDARETMNVVIIKEPDQKFDPECIHHYSAMLLSTDMSKQLQHAKMTSGNFQHLLVHDGNPTAYNCFTDKSALFGIMKDHLGELLPTQKAYCILNNEINAGKILNDFSDEKEIILKLPKEANATGVFIVNKDFLNKLHKIHLADLYLKYFKGLSIGKTELKYTALNILKWASKYRNYLNLIKSPLSMGREFLSDVKNSLFKKDDVLIAQRKISAKKVEHKNEEYDSTIHIIATAYHDKGQTHITCHDGYHKLPQSPIGKGSSRKQTISKINHSRLPWKKETEAAFLSDSDKLEIFRQLEDGLQKAFHYAFTESSANVIKKLLSDENLAIRLVGWQMLVDDRLNNVCEAETADLTPLVHALSQESWDIRQKMINDIQRRSYETLSSFDQDISEPVRKLCESLGLVNDEEAPILSYLDL